MRLIDADALMADIEATIENSGCVNHEGEILDCIAYADEIDAVPVVRCENCKYSENNTEYCKNNKHIYCTLMGRNDIVNNSDYCSYGMKMEDKP